MNGMSSFTFVNALLLHKVQFVKKHFYFAKISLLFNLFFYFHHFIVLSPIAFTFTKFLLLSQLFLHHKMQKFVYLHHKFVFLQHADHLYVQHAGLAIT